jgi:hypothetical protein
MLKRSMDKPRAALAELFTRLQHADHLSAELESKFKELKNRRLIKNEKLKQLASCLDALLTEAWEAFEHRASRADYPVLIREDQVQERFQISQATLYRRRKTQEIPYIRDHEGVIWYPVADLIRYHLKGRTELRLPKTGRPRKF